MKKLTVKLDDKHTFVLEPDPEQYGFAMWQVFDAEGEAIEGAANRYSALPGGNDASYIIGPNGDFKLFAEKELSPAAARKVKRADVQAYLKTLPLPRYETGLRAVKTGTRAIEKKKSTKKAPTVVNGGAGKYGRIGTAAELYKRLIMEHGMNNEQAHAEVESQLGKKAAGGANYPGWYRTWLNGHGFKAPPSKPFKK